MALIGREGGKAEFLAPVDSIERPATRVPEYPPYAGGSLGPYAESSLRTARMNPPKRMCTDRNGGTDEGSQEKGRRTSPPACGPTSTAGHWDWVGDSGQMHGAPIRPDLWFWFQTH